MTVFYIYIFRIPESDFKKNPESDGKELVGMEGWELV
jgi:hypothetical protein